MNRILVAILSLLFFVLSYEGTYAFFNVYPKLKEYPLADGEDPGTPLFLTPLIENGEIQEARTKALVQHKDMGNVISYSGYFTVNKKYNSNLFFWFFPAMNNPETAPVVLWLQGGPGGTSLAGLFLENGPFIVTANKTLKMRQYSWTLEHNVIYIDNPVGTGYSFTDNKKGYARNEVEVGRNLHTALVQFFLLFPELQNNDFFVTGESYAGKYVPAVSHAIKNHNIKAKTKINLKGLAIGDGLSDPENQLQYGDYLYQIGLIDQNGKAEYQKYERKARYLEDLVEHYKVLVYNGQLDIIVAYPLTENYIQKMKWSGAYKFAKAPRKLWMVGNDLAGYAKSVDNLTEVLVRNAGHMVPYDQPKWALDLITRFTHNKGF
ncbi:Vitellogenic carboxypeptidase [Camponotus floridanus]|uniref:Carboxypeptidase n=1 Tax=Camponotus floridanus TaxID=104421 RepID=E2AY02_CAMFO|nr:Vitellogenic carboxypeptidase [Camponotus floridanus]